MAPRSKQRTILPGEKDAAEEQIVQQQRTVSYDTKEFTVGYIVQEFERGLFYIPEYQREFVWDERKKSRFIESLLLGFPIPFLFVADMPTGLLEVVDGVQRIMTLRAFLTDDLELSGLERLYGLNGFRYSDLPMSQQRKLSTRSLRMVALAQSTDDVTRFDLFERINTGSEELSAAELRRGAYAGAFYDLVRECTRNTKFIRRCPITSGLRKRGEAEELVLRFFAYSERYREFRHSVSGFLNIYVRDKSREFDADELKTRFTRMVDFVDRYFPYGFAKSPTSTATPRVRFEAISVGVHLALQSDPVLVPSEFGWLESREFRQLTTTHASNSPDRLRGRVEFVRDHLLESRNA